MLFQRIIFILLNLLIIANTSISNIKHKYMLKKLIHGLKKNTKIAQLHYLHHLKKGRSVSEDEEKNNSSTILLLKSKNVPKFIETVRNYGQIVDVSKYSGQRFKRAVVKYLQKNTIPTVKKTRELSTRKPKTRNVPILRLILDPNVKLDLEQVVDNFRGILKEDVEQNDGNLFHLLNMIGSLRDSLISAINIVPLEAFVPSTYAIVPKDQIENNDQADFAKKINRNNVRNINYEESNEADEVSRTVMKFGKVIANSVDATKRSIGHISDMFQSAKNLVYNIGENIPKAALSHKHYVPVVKVSNKA